MHQITFHFFAVVLIFQLIAVEIKGFAIGTFIHRCGHDATVCHNLKLKGQSNGSDFLQDSVSRRTAVSSIILPAIGIVGSYAPTGWTTANAAVVSRTDRKLTIVITGSNSGIGFNGACRLARRGHKVVLACRTLEKAKTSADEIQKASETQVWGFQPDVIPEQCDLASLESIRAFSTSLQSAFPQEDYSIDVLCLNAGIARNTAATDALRTKEGFERTVGINHLGHFYLQKLLRPHLNEKTGRIIVTASTVHDPESPGGSQGSRASLGDLAGLKQIEFDMVDGGRFDPDKAYKDSKLCNVLFTRELARRLQTSGSQIVANCFNPGLILGTGLYRDQNPLLIKVFDVAAGLFRVAESVDWGGGALEFMALDRNVGFQNGIYYDSPAGTSRYGQDAYGSRFNVGQISREARDDSKGERLWELSNSLIEKALQRQETVVR